LEVEIKARIRDLRRTMMRLKKLGAVKVKEERQTDIYLRAPHKNLGEKDEVLRIREGIVDTMTYKGPRIGRDAKVREHLEVAISSGETARKILEKMDFKKVAEINKTRQTYKIKDLLVAVDKVRKFGPYVEIEGMAKSRRELPKLTDKIYDVLYKIGIPREDEEKRTYFEIITGGN